MRESRREASEAAFIGDDWIDLSVMKHAGLAMSVPNAVPEVLETADWVSNRRGGDGAVREAISFILKARGMFDKAMKQWAE